MQSASQICDASNAALLAFGLREIHVTTPRNSLYIQPAEVRFGRMGSRRRLLRDVFANEGEAFAFMLRGLRRRATAPTRIGVLYLCVRSSVEAHELLHAVDIDATSRISR